jgi:Putative polyhydroxyalkanoic acid system protein (PHA_gran_rgn)
MNLISPPWIRRRGRGRGAIPSPLHVEPVGNRSVDFRSGMPLIDITLQHGQTLEEARRRLERTVKEANAQFRSMIQRVDWAADRSRVKLDGVGFWVEMSVDAQVLHATGDIPILGRLLGSQMTSGLRQIIERTFQKKLPS